MREVIDRVHIDVTDTRDNLMLAKMTQAHHANNYRSDSFPYKVGDLVMLSTLNRHREYKNIEEQRVAKFMPRFDGPYLVMDTHADMSTMTLNIPSAPNVFPTFHTSLIKPFRQNDHDKYPSHTLEKPGPIEVDSQLEYYMDCILDHKKVG